jgi:hypothetical protein
VTKKPWRFRRKRSDSEPESERQDTNPTGSEGTPPGEDPNIDRFVWKDGDLEVLYDPYTPEEEEKRRKKYQS